MILQGSTVDKNQPIVTPAYAGGHPLIVRFGVTGRGMGSRLRGNDELLGFEVEA